MLNMQNIITTARAVAAISMVFLPLLLWYCLAAIIFITSLLLFLISATCDLSVLYADNPVCHLGDFLVVSNHHNGLMIFYGAGFKKPYNLHTRY